MSARLYVGNLPFECTTEDLRAEFQAHGEIVDVHVKQTEYGKSRGFGVVEFSSVKDADYAIDKYKNQEFMGRRLLVREDRGATKGKGRGGGGYGGRGGYGGYDDRDRGYGRDDYDRGYGGRDRGRYDSRDRGGRGGRYDSRDRGGRGGRYDSRGRGDSRDRGGYGRDRSRSPRRDRSRSPRYN